MIQRIQTLFLVLAAVLSAAVMFLPLTNFSVSGQDIVNGTFFYEFDIFLFGIKNLEGIYPDNIGNILNMTLYIALLSVIILISTASIFLYKNRPLQMKLCRLNLILSIAFVVFLLYLPGTLVEKLTSMQTDFVNYKFKIGVYVQLAVLVFLFLANKFIKRDEMLVKSADRLR